METLFLCVYVLGISDQELGIMNQVNREHGSGNMDQCTKVKEQEIVN